jgi:hypothetical protein
MRGEEATTRRGSCARIHEGEGARCELVTKDSQEKTHRASVHSVCTHKVWPVRPRE